MTERMAIQLQEEGVLILPAYLRDRIGLKAGDILELSELNGGILLTPRRAVDKKEPDLMDNDPQFWNKLKSTQEMLEDL